MSRNKVRGAGNRAPKDTASTTTDTQGDTPSLPDTIPAELRFMPIARLMAQSCEGWEATVVRSKSSPAFQRQIESASALDAAPSPCTHLDTLPVVTLPDPDDPDCVPSIIAGRDLIIAAHSLELPKVPCLVCSHDDAQSVLRELDRRRHRAKLERERGDEYYSSLHDDAYAYLAR